MQSEGIISGGVRSEIGDTPLMNNRATRAGLGTVEYGVKFHGPLKWGCGWFVDFCGYDAIDSRTRTQIRARRANQASFKTKLDAFFVYSGLIWEF